ncbi:uncharacterized protein [Nicotiana tomentosiformis]|uniref:uncharacterized protein n=1 Tax=Nicotiana tomentosiformis TaxID=4098 RepID=UPI00388C920C
MSCYICGDPRHIAIFCPMSQGNMQQQGSRAMVLAPIVLPPSQPARGRGQAARGGDSRSYTVYCDASHVGLGAVFMQDGKPAVYVQEKRSQFELLKDYVITILYHPRKANVVVDALSRKVVSMGSLAYIPVGERPLAADIQTFANQFVMLDVLEPSRVLACTVARSSLYERIRKQQYDDPHLIVLKNTVRHDDAKQVVVGEDGVLRMQGRICVPNVDELRELILK